MKHQAYLDCYYEMSGKASEIARMLSLSAIALIWVFKLETEQGVKLPPELLIPAAIVVLAMTLDFAQYLYLALAWRLYFSNIEQRNAPPDTEFKHPNWIPRVAEIMFAGKVLLVLLAYVMLGEYLWRRVF